MPNKQQKQMMRAANKQGFEAAKKAAEAESEEFEIGRSKARLERLTKEANAGRPSEEGRSRLDLPALSVRTRKWLQRVEKKTT